MQITLYRCMAEENRVDKSGYFESNKNFQGTLREPSSVLDLAITIESSTFLDYNYAYIPDFNRYYFINDIVALNKNLWEVYLSVDVLMSYKDGIGNLRAFVERSESLYDDRLIDKKAIIETGLKYEVHEIDNNVFTQFEPADVQHTSWRFVMNGYKLSTTDLVT